MLCLGHARRHFHDLHVAVGSPIAREAFERFSELYQIERQIKGRSPEQRRCEREARAWPRLRALHAWLSLTLPKVTTSSELARAIRYTIKPRTGMRLPTTIRMARRDRQPTRGTANPPGHTRQVQLFVRRLEYRSGAGRCRL